MADVSASAVAALERMHPLRHDLNVPDYETSDAGDALGQHIRGFFAGHKIAKRTWPLVPIETRIPGFFVHEIEPGPRFPGWTYVSSGCWRATAENGHGLEFVLSARNADQRHLELVSMAGYYHAGPKSQRLDVGHTLPIGEPWSVPGSLDHLFVSQPYAYAPDLDGLRWQTGHARLLSLMPITAAERDFKIAHGQEALEQRLEDEAVDFLNPSRASVA